MQHFPIINTLDFKLHARTAANTHCKRTHNCKHTYAHLIFKMAAPRDNSSYQMTKTVIKDYVKRDDPAFYGPLQPIYRKHTHPFAPSRMPLC